MAKKQNNDESVLETAAKKIGKAAGKVATTVGVKSDQPTPKSAKPGKLIKKDKQRLPRREKKALQKAAAKRSGAQQ